MASAGTLSDSQSGREPKCPAQTTHKPKENAMATEPDRPTSPVPQIVGQDFHTGCPIIECCGRKSKPITRIGQTEVCEVCLTAYHCDQMGTVFSCKLDQEAIDYIRDMRAIRTRAQPNAKDHRAGEAGSGASTCWTEGQ
jgi:hypothetical protein